MTFLHIDAFFIDVSAGIKYLLLVSVHFVIIVLQRGAVYVQVRSVSEAEVETAQFLQRY